MAFRDSNIIIIECNRTVVRAGLGLHELLGRPRVEIQARVGLRKSGSSADASGFNALNRANEPFASTSRAATAFPSISYPNASVNDYLVGVQLDEALASGQDIEVSWPFAAGDVADWTQAEALWKHILFNQLQRRRAQNESPVLLSTFAGLARSTYEKICQVFFERFNVAGFGILELPMAQLYAVNTLSGVVVDIEEEVTEVTPIFDGFIVHHARGTLPIGLSQCQHYLAHLLKSNQSVVNTLSPPTNPLDPATLHATLFDLVKQIWRDNTIRVPSDGETAIIEDEGVTDIAAVVAAGKEKAVIESGLKKKATAKASAAEQARAREIEALDLITVQFREHSLTLGKERHRLFEPLFDPSLLAGIPGVHFPGLEEDTLLSIQDFLGHLIDQIDIDHRHYIWQGILVTGDTTGHVKGLGVALQSRVQPFLCSPDIINEVQPRSAHVANVPDYYAEYRETGNGYAAFLGSSIAAKIVFNDSSARSFVSKADYTASGPHSIIEMTPALL